MADMTERIDSGAIYRRFGERPRNLLLTPDSAQSWTRIGGAEFDIGPNMSCYMLVRKELNGTC